MTKDSAERLVVDLSPQPPTDEEEAAREAEQRQAEQAREDERCHREVALEVVKRHLWAIDGLYRSIDLHFYAACESAYPLSKALYDRLQAIHTLFETGTDQVRRELIP